MRGRFGQKRTQRSGGSSSAHRMRLNYLECKQQKRIVAHPRSTLRSLPKTKDDQRGCDHRLDGPGISLRRRNPSVGFVRLKLMKYGSNCPFTQTMAPDLSVPVGHCPRTGGWNNGGQKGGEKMRGIRWREGAEVEKKSTRPWRMIIRTGPTNDRRRPLTSRSLLLWVRIIRCKSIRRMSGSKSADTYALTDCGGRGKFRDGVASAEKPQPGNH